MTNKKGLVSHHLGSHLDAIELIFCVHSYAKYIILMLELGSLYYTCKEVDLVVSLKKCK